MQRVDHDCAFLVEEDVYKNKLEFLVFKPNASFHFICKIWPRSACICFGPGFFFVHLKLFIDGIVTFPTSSTPSHHCEHRCGDSNTDQRSSSDRCCGRDVSLSLCVKHTPKAAKSVGTPKKENKG